LGSAVIASDWARVGSITQVAELAQVAALRGGGAWKSGEVEPAGRNLRGGATGEIGGKAQVLEGGNKLWCGRGGSQEKSKDGKDLHGYVECLKLAWG